MRRLLALIVFVSALSLGVYAIADTDTPQAENQKPLIKCATCGVEFTSKAGQEEHLKAHPDHKAAPSTLYKCETCGVEFTSQAGLEDHVKVSPGHKPAKIEGQYTP